jgi:hypothetical protein
MVKENGIPVIVSSNSLIYSEYLQSGYEIIYSNNKRACEEYLTEMVFEMSKLD